jgi:hypothetical protein
VEASDEIKAAMEKSGVVGSPNVRFAGNVCFAGTA